MNVVNRSFIIRPLLTGSLPLMSAVVYETLFEIHETPDDIRRI